MLVTPSTNEVEWKVQADIGTTYFEVSTSLLHNCWGIPLHGENYSSWTQYCVKACQEVFEDDIIETRIKDTTRMNLNTRILHLICCQMLVPRNGSYSSMTKLDLWLMQCIMARKRPNLCILLINQMIESFSGKNRTLPYGMALSELLDSEVGNLEHARKVYLIPSQHINGYTTLRIGFQYQNGTWAWSGKKRKAEEPTPAIPTSNILSSSTPPSTSPTHEDLIVHGFTEIKSDFSIFR